MPYPFATSKQTLAVCSEVEARLSDHVSTEGPQVDRLGRVQEDLLRQLGVLIQGVLGGRGHSPYHWLFYWLSLVHCLDKTWIQIFNYPPPLFDAALTTIANVQELTLPLASVKALTRIQSKVSGMAYKLNTISQRLARVQV